MASSLALSYCLYLWQREHDLSCLPELPLSGHTWGADVHEHAAIVRDVEQFARQHITLTTSQEAKRPYSQHSTNTNVSTNVKLTSARKTIHRGYPTPGMVVPYPTLVACSLQTNATSSEPMIAPSTWPEMYPPKSK